MLSRYRLLLVAVGAAATTAASPAHSAILTQNTDPVTFSTNGNQTAGSPNTTALFFQPFTASTPDKLIDVSLKFAPGATFGGNATLVNIAQGQLATFTGSVLPAFTFSAPGGIATGNSSALSFSSNTLFNPVGNPVTLATPTLNGTYTSTAVPLPIAGIQAYWAGAPSIASYYATWSVTGDIPGQSFGSVISASLPPGSLTGEIFLSYSYITDEPVPSPLPILGAGAAFGFSRKLRKRIRSSAP